MGKTVDTAYYDKMVNTPVSRLVIALGIPTTISMLVTNIYNMADTFFVSSLGNSASGAVGIVFGLMAIIQAVGFMFGHGAGSLIARRLGDKDIKSAEEYASVSFFAAIAAGCIIGLIAGAVINIVADPLLIFVFDMGIDGAGVSTALSQCISFLILLSMFLRGKTQSRIRIKAVKNIMDRRLGTVMITGFPSLIRQGLNSLSTMVLNSLAGGYGDAAVAAMSIVNRISFFIFAVGLGIGQGFQPVSSFNYGAKKYSRVKQAFRFTFLAGELLLGTLAVVGFFVSGNLIELFRNDSEVIAVGTVALRFQLVALLFQPLTICSTMLFQSVGANGQATVMALFRSGIFFIPTIFILSNIFGLTGIQIAQPIADVLAFMVALPMVMSFLRSMPKDE